MKCCNWDCSQPSIFSPFSSISERRTRGSGNESRKTWTLAQNKRREGHLRGRGTKNLSPCNNFLVNYWYKKMVKHNNSSNCMPNLKLPYLYFKVIKAQEEVKHMRVVKSHAQFGEKC